MLRCRPPRAAVPRHSPCERLLTSRPPGPAHKERVTQLSDHATPDADQGTEPDARFTLANERTFLAWSRTSLALVVGGPSTRARDAMTRRSPPIVSVPARTAPAPIRKVSAVPSAVVIFVHNPK